MRKKNILGIIIISCFVLSTPVLMYISSARSIAKHICANLLGQNLIVTSEQCTISWNKYKYIPAMFPLGVDQNYVERGMSGLYLESDHGSIKFYLLRFSSPQGLMWLFSEQVVFEFKDNNLFQISFEFY